MTKRTAEFIFVAIFLFVSCELFEEPDYLDIKKTDLPRTSAPQIEQIDAFSLEIKWSLPKENNHLIDSFLLETFSQIDSITVDRDMFDSLMTKSANSHSRTILINKDDSILVETAYTDTVSYEYLDYVAGFNLWNYYRVTVLFDRIESYSDFTSSGFYFNFPAPVGYSVTQLSESQLELTWDKSDYATGYKIVRDDDTFETLDTVFIDKSTDPNYDILRDSIFTVNGIQPNKNNSYILTAYAEKDSIRRWSKSSSFNGILELINPVIVDAKPINDTSIRLYMPKENLDTSFVSLFVLRRQYTSQWQCIDTILIDKSEMNKYLLNSRQQYLIDVNSTLENEAQYKLIAKGYINALSSNILTSAPLPSDLAGFTYVEGGEFKYGCDTCDTVVERIVTDSVSSFYLSINEYTGEWPNVGDGIKEPMDNLSWVEAVQICSTLSYEYGWSFRLPSEEEWEYAAKWDIFNQDIDFNGYDYPWQSNTVSGDNANYMNSGDPYDNGLTPIGYYNGFNGTIDSFSPFGVYDMGGNVLEWCGSGDEFQDLSEIVGINYVGHDLVKPLRGGGFWHDPVWLKTTTRLEYDPELKVNGFGFRIVMENP